MFLNAKIETMPDHPKLLLSIAFTLLCGFSLASCSSHNSLRKFDDGDISKEMSADLAKKFEVKDVDANTASVTVAPSATPTPKPKKTHSKKLKMKPNVPLPELVSTPAPNVPPLRRVDPLPFSVGEKLEYGIRYVGVTAGFLNLEVLPFKDLNNRKVFHFQGKIRTVKLFELVYRVNDTVESFWDYDGLFSYKFTMDLDESKQNRKLIELYDYDKKQSFYWNRVDHVEKGFSEKKENFEIPLWAQDPVSILYYFRTTNLPADPTIETRIPLILDGKPWEGVVKYEKTTQIYAGGKDREARLFKFDNYQNGELKNRDNHIWISTDEHHYVLRVEAKVKVGSFAVALDKIL